MKVVAVFQFYFPYVLPRAADWLGTRLSFEFPDFIVEVHPREPAEKLFPSEIDKTLSTMAVILSRISLPTSVVSLTVRDRCHDRIEVRVHRELALAEHVKQADIQEAFLEAAIRGCNSFLDHCRVASWQPFITGVERHYRLEDQRYYILSPYSVSWFNGRSGKFLPAYQGEVNAVASAGAIPSPERGLVSIALIQQSLQEGEQTNLPHSLLIDAEERIITLRLREAILALGTACEVASDEYLQRSGRAMDPQVERIRRLHVSFAEKHLHRLPNFVSRRSLKSEDLAIFQLVEKMYRVRNSLAHEGLLCYADAGSLVKVDQPIATKFLAASQHTVQWLAEL